MNPCGSRGTQCIHQDFLHILDTDKYQQSASMCVYQATQDIIVSFPVIQIPMTSLI
jgi:hypothetical protein